MRLLCTSDSIAFIQSLRIALEGENIAVHCSDPLLNPVGLLGPIAGAGGRIYVLQEDDWARAVEIYRELDKSADTPQQAPATGTPSRWIAIVVGVIATGVACALVASSR